MKKNFFAAAILALAFFSTPLSAAELIYSQAISVGANNSSSPNGATSTAANLRLTLGGVTDLHIPEHHNQIFGGGAVDVFGINGHVVAAPVGVMVFGGQTEAQLSTRASWSAVTGAMAGVEILVPMNSYINMDGIFSLKGGVTFFQKNVGGAKSMVSLGIQRDF